jgi:hypothetical protein
MSAPLQVIALSFSRGAGSQDKILAEVDRVRGRGVLRLLDLLLVARSQDGTVERLSIGDDEDFGSLLAGVVLPADGGPARPASADGLAAVDRAGARALAESVEPGTALAFLLVEHCWAAPLFDAIAETGGTLIGEGFLTAETGLVVGAEVAAMEEAAEVIARAQADEASAVLAAAAAQAEAAQAVAESQRIASAAAAGGVRALITAGLVDEAAAHEAVTALTAAGLIVAAAGQAAADAVADEIASVEAAGEVAAGSVAESLITTAAAGQIAAEAASQAGARVKGGVDHQGRGPGPAVPARTAPLLRHRRHAGHLPVRSQGASGTPVSQARRPQPGPGGQPGPLPGPHPRQVTRARTLRYYRRDQ